MTSDIITQVISLKEYIGKKKMKTVEELSLFIIENDLSLLYSAILTACIIYL